MNTQELLQRIRQSGFLPEEAADPEYTDDKLLDEATDRIRSHFGDAIQRSRSNYGLQTVVVTTTSQEVRVPDRAVMSGLHSVELVGINVPPLGQIEPHQTHNFQTSGIPTSFTIEGGSIFLYPAPSSSTQVKLRYFIRPSRLVAPQTKGVITAVSSTSVTVNVVPDDMLTATPIVTGSYIDIQRPHGWFDLVSVQQVCTISGLTITCNPGSAQVGDLVRAANQTDLPQIPEDFHRLLADLTAVKVLVEKGMDAKASTLASVIKGDQERFASMLAPRVRTQPVRRPIRFL